MRGDFTKNSECDIKDWKLVKVDPDESAIKALLTSNSFDLFIDGNLDGTLTVNIDDSVDYTTFSDGQTASGLWTYKFTNQPTLTIDEKGCAS